MFKSFLLLLVFSFCGETAASAFEAPCLSPPGGDPPQCAFFGWCNSNFDETSGNVTFSCECHPGTTGLACDDKLYFVQNAENLLVGFYVFGALFLVIAVLALVVLIRTLLLLSRSPSASFTQTCVVHIMGLAAICLSCIFNAIFFLSSPDDVALESQSGVLISAISFNLGIALGVVSAIIAGCIFIHLASGLGRNTGGAWAKWLLWTMSIICIVLVIFAIVMGSIQLFFQRVLFAFLVAVVVILIIVLIVSLVAGVKVFVKFKGASRMVGKDESREKILRKFSFKLIILSIFGLCAVALTITSGLVSSRSDPSATIVFTVKAVFTFVSICWGLAFIWYFLLPAPQKRNQSRSSATTPTFTNTSVSETNTELITGKQGPLQKSWESSAKVITL